MLEELSQNKISITKGGLLYFLQTIIGTRQLSRNDVLILCSHAPGKYRISAIETIQYCKAFKWISEEGIILINDNLLDILNDTGTLNNKLIFDTISLLFTSDVFKIDMFSFNIQAQRVYFKNELFPLAYSSLRNTLINQGFFEIEHHPQTSTLYVATPFEIEIQKFSQKLRTTFTLEQLRIKIEKDSIAGEKAEAFAFEFEKKRLQEPLSSKVRIISSLDVSAGYDILSFDSDESVEFDRFIEVKASKRGNDFFWSSNEYEFAKLKGNQYFLYLVDLSKINDQDYVPTMIINPASSIMDSGDWLVETETFHVRHI